MARGIALIVEDDEDIVEVVVYNLDQAGFDVHAVTTGEAALEWICTQHPDLVILDLMLPGIDGIDVCKRLKDDIDPGRHEVRVDGTPVSLTATEFGVLHMLARKPGWVFTRHQIVDAVRGVGYRLRA